jgi:hypothetical protein
VQGPTGVSKTAARMRDDDSSGEVIGDPQNAQVASQIVERAPQFPQCAELMATPPRLRE